MPPVRIASYNVESLFERPVAMNQETWADGRQVLEWFAQLNTILNNDAYTDQDKASIVELITKLKLNRSDESRWAVLRQNRGKLLKRAPRQPPTVVANGRSDWIGWLELKKEALTVTAIENTARVVRDVRADVQAVVEAESRVALKAFSDVLLPRVQGAPFDHVMLIDGNDDRGIDVGVLTRASHEIADIRSHVDDADAQGIIFSRDCPEYTITTAGGGRLVLLVNHFKSKGYGSTAANNGRRLRQATRVAEIYTRLQNDGEQYVVVLGDFNDTPESAQLNPLLAGTDLKDISTHPSFDDGGRPGTFGNCGKSEKFDYILLSPQLFQVVQGGGVYRKGSWGGKNGTLWEHFPEVKRGVDAASDHIAIFADVVL
jgi:endonuclease/exonuclease/phosphatase family metal-dependent hydrolase